MKVRSLKLSRELEQALREHAREKGVTDSFVMREAIAEYLATPEGGEPQAPRSFGALAADLAGCVEAAPDLSTNKKHLAGFGR